MVCIVRVLQNTHTADMISYDKLGQHREKRSYKDYRLKFIRSDTYAA